MASPKDIKIVTTAPVSFDLAAWEADKAQYAEPRWRHLNPAFEILTYRHMFTPAQVAAAENLKIEYEEGLEEHRETYADESAAILAAADGFARQYVGTALWTGIEYPYGDARADSDNLYDADSEWVTPDTLRAMIADCEAFQRDNAAALEEAYSSDVYIQGERYNETNAGHDFWLTRNGHGAGFWDRGLPDDGKALTAAAKKFGEYNLCMGDNGEVGSM